MSRRHQEEREDGLARAFSCTAVAHCLHAALSEGGGDALGAWMLG